MTQLPTPRLKILAVASSGGHWEQMLLLREVLDEHDVVYATTNRDLLERAGITGGHVLSDCNRNTPMLALRCLVHAFRIVARERPDCVISTGALPGLFVMVAAWLRGARTIWLDSVANVEKPSMCGAVAQHFVTLALTQWKHVAKGERPAYKGSLL